MGNHLASYNGTDKMRDLVKEHSSILLVMGRFGISLGFGDKSVAEVCRAHQVDMRTFIEVANFCSGRECRFDNISLQALIQYLKEAHRYFLEFNLPHIRRKLIEALDCSGSSEIAMLIVRFYDDYVSEVRRHMEHEDKVVFVYVEQLVQGMLRKGYTISTFEGKHTPIGSKLRELKNLIIQYYPERNSYLLNEVLLNIIQCEEDLGQHCSIEDKLFVPAVRQLEAQVKQQGQTLYTDEEASDTPEGNRPESLSDRERDVLICIAKGMSMKEIADQLCLSVHTVTTHKRNISTKLQIHTSVGLAIYAIANKLIDLQDV